MLDVLLIILDDVGDSAMFYNRHPSAIVAPMPRMETLAGQGVICDGFRSTHLCSPTRASLLTGRYSIKNRVDENGDALPSTEYTYADDFKSRGYTTALFGKWGLGDSNLDNPRILGGFDHFAGQSNLGLAPTNYFVYDMTVNGGTPFTVGTYQTTQTVNDAIAWIDAQSGNWFATVALFASHVVFQFPPDELTTMTDDGTSRLRYRATIEAADVEIGRLLDSVNMTTTLVVIMGDNGAYYMTPPQLNTKATAYDDAVQVPFIVAGAEVSTAKPTRPEVMRTVDVYPSLLSAATGFAPNSPNALDGVDMSGLWKNQVVRSNLTNINKVPASEVVTAHDQTWKLWDYTSATDLFFNLSLDPQEQTPISIGSLTGASLIAYNNLRYALTTFTNKTGEQAVVEVNYSQPSIVTGGIQVVSGSVSVSAPAVGSATITAPTKTGATDYTLWVRDNPFGSWVDSGIEETVVGSVVSFTDPAPVGRKEYRITNNALEP